MEKLDPKSKIKVAETIKHLMRALDTADGNNDGIIHRAPALGLLTKKLETAMEAWEKPLYGMLRQKFLEGGLTFPRPTNEDIDKMVEQMQVPNLDDLRKLPKIPEPPRWQQKNPKRYT